MTFQVQAGKLRADPLGTEASVPMDDYVDVAVLAEPEEGRERGRVLATERRRLTGGTHTSSWWWTRSRGRWAWTRASSWWTGSPGTT